MSCALTFSRYCAIIFTFIIAILLIEIEVEDMRLSTFYFGLLGLSSSFVLGDQSHSWSGQWSSHTYINSVSSSAATQILSQVQSQTSTSPAASQTYSSSAATYTNPVYNKFGADPWVIKDGNYYYMTYSTNDNVTILRSNTLTSVPNLATLSSSHLVIQLLTP